MLELNHISFCADAEKEILKDINMTVKDGEFLVVTGPNGGGKSTLAKSLPVLKRRAAERLYWMEKILPESPLLHGQRLASALRFSSRYGSKG